MIHTSSYLEFQNMLSNTYSISWDCGKDADYHGESYPALAPKKTFWRIYKDNLGRIPIEENTRFYVEEYWKEVLSNLNPIKVYRELDYSTLLCYENNNEFCHRHIVAAWFEILLGIKVSEVNCKFKEVDRPQYIKEYLEDAIRKTKDMHGFSPLRDLYIYEKSKMLENESADFMRYDTNNEEFKYKRYNTLRKIKD